MFFSIGLAVLIALIAVFWIQFTQDDPSPVSQDSLSQEIIDRWGAGLPDGFEKVEINGILDGKGYLFARLSYQESVSSLLANWKTVTPETEDNFYALLDEYADQNTLSQEQQKQLEEYRPHIEDNWISFSMRDEENTASVIFLLYDQSSNVMYILEKQV